MFASQACAPRCIIAFSIYCVMMPDNVVDDANVNGDQEGGPSKKELDRKVNSSDLYNRLINGAIN